MMKLFYHRLNGFLQCRGGSIATSITVKGSGLFLTHFLVVLAGILASWVAHQGHHVLDSQNFAWPLKTCSNE
jgi:hypothetical protein